MEYDERKLKLIKEAQDDDEILIIINKIYDEGVYDGMNNLEEE